MIVVDASAIVEWLMATPRGQETRRAIEAHHNVIAAPSIVDVEVAQVMRRSVRAGIMQSERAWAALKTLSDTPIQRFDGVDLLPRIWQLRDALTAYDAAYVSLAEVLAAPLLTCDTGIASAKSHAARVILIR